MEAVLESPHSILSTKTPQKDYSSFVVTDSDLESYIHYLNTIQESKRGQVIETSPVVHNGEIVYYIINFESGWQLLSADKRGPIVLADNDDGFFTLSEANPCLLTWLDKIVDDIEFRRFNSDEYYNGSSGV